MKPLLLTMLCTLLSHAQVNILTANGNNYRTNANLIEVQLSPATVNLSTFGKVGVFPVDGQLYAQSLYVTGLPLSGGSTQNSVFVATLHSRVYAFDADCISPVSLLWQANLRPSVPASLLFGQYGDINVEVGILSTPAIDLQRGVLDVVADALVRGVPAYSLHTLDLAAGAEPAEWSDADWRVRAWEGFGISRGRHYVFEPQQPIQRPGLVPFANPG